MNDTERGRESKKGRKVVIARIDIYTRKKESERDRETFEKKKKNERSNWKDKVKEEVRSGDDKVHAFNTRYIHLSSYIHINSLICTYIHVYRVQQKICMVYAVLERLQKMNMKSPLSIFPTTNSILLN